MVSLRATCVLICLAATTSAEETDFSYQGNDLDVSPLVEEDSDVVQDKQDTYLAPSSSNTNSQGYLYYYDPKPDYPIDKASQSYGAPPKENAVKDNNPPKFLGLPIGVSFIVAIGIFIGLCVVIIDTSTLSTVIINKYVQLVNLKDRYRIFFTL